MLPIIFCFLLAFSGHTTACFATFKGMGNGVRAVDTKPVTRDIIDDDLKKKMRARPDCAWATVHKPYSYVECLSHQESNVLKYTIRASGTGQDARNWADDIIENAWMMCSEGNSWCVTEDVGKRNLTTPSLRSHAVDHFTRKVFRSDGFEITFGFRSPGWLWRCGRWGTDNNHKCMTEAVRKATCYDVSFANGLACRNKNYFGDNYLDEGSQPYGHPYIDEYDDNLAGPN